MFTVHINTLVLPDENLYLWAIDKNNTLAPR